MKRNELEDAIRLFTKPAPMTIEDERRATLENMRRLRAERLAREAKNPPRRYKRTNS